MSIKIYHTIPYERGLKSSNVSVWPPDPNLILNLDKYVWETFKPTCTLYSIIIVPGVCKCLISITGTHISIKYIFIWKLQWCLFTFEGILIYDSSSLTSETNLWDKKYFWSWCKIDPLKDLPEFMVCLCTHTFWTSRDIGKVTFIILHQQVHLYPQLPCGPYSISAW